MTGVKRQNPHHDLHSYRAVSSLRGIITKTGIKRGVPVPKNLKGINLSLLSEIYQTARTVF